jgi:NAD(P)H-dependent FMN reductase
MKVLSFAGSLRKESSNKKLAREAVPRLDSHALARAEFADLREYPMPIYDGDQEKEGIPEAVIRLGAGIAEADALIVATPEYNGSISSVLKNTDPGAIMTGRTRDFAAPLPAVRAHADTE